MTIEKKTVTGDKFARAEMSSFLMNSGYSGVDPGKFPGSPSESEYSQSSYLGSHSDYYSHMQTAAAAQHYGYGASAAAAMSGYPNPRDPMGYSNYYQQCSAMTPQQVQRRTRPSCQEARGWCP